MNRLVDEVSPYLQLHSHHPIDWWPWSPEAFVEAKERNVPLLISVGYASCHWCHVMADESFADPNVAEFVNAKFVAIKVDRQERPDVDAALMSATQALTGQGGWPMTVFATPDGTPFFAGTYFPAERRGNLPAFLELCEALSSAWESRADEVADSAAQIAEHVASFSELESGPVPSIWEVLEEVAGKFDLLHGGFGSAPKFPMPTLLEALLVKGEPGCLDMAQRTCEAMARGGIYDQVGGGFHRYAVDASWSVPHFEKMLDDNALLLGAFTRAWRRTADHDGNLRQLIERVIAQTAAWLERELLLESGAFAAALDADSSDIRGVAHEGIYYLWTPELLQDALGAEDGEWAINAFHVTSSGNVDSGLSTLILSGRIDFDRLDLVTEKLLVERQNRFAPARDDAVIASWNGWTIEALVTAGMIFNQPHWLNLARGAAEELWRTHWVDGELRRLSRAGVATTAPGTAEDYGAVALGFARLAGALGEAIWATRAALLLKAADSLFSASDGGFYDSAANGLFVRPRSVTDSPDPGGTAVLVEAFHAIGLLLDRPDFTERAAAAIKTTYSAVKEFPLQTGASLAQILIDDEARTGLGRASIVVVGDPMSELARAAWRMAPAGSVIMAGAEGTEGFAHHFDNREAGFVYVCRGATCLEPVSEIDELRNTLWSRC